MISQEITTDDFNWWHYYLAVPRLIKVATLDGQPVADAFTVVAYDHTDGWSAYQVLYKKGRRCFKTLAHLTGPDGKNVPRYHHIDFAHTYAAITVGKYPDTPENYQRFTGAGVHIPITKTDRRITADMWKEINAVGQAEMIHIYPGGLWAIERNFDDGQGRFVCPPFCDVKIESIYMDTIERELFDHFLIGGLSF